MKNFIRLHASYTGRTQCIILNIERISFVEMGPGVKVHVDGMVLMIDSEVEANRLVEAMGLIRS